MKELLHQYGPLVWSLARSFTHSIADAEDASQEVFLHLWKKAGQYDPALGLEIQFISVAARRRLIDWVRAHSKPTVVVNRSFESAESRSLSDRLLNDEEAARAWNVLSKLVLEQQTVLVLSFVHGLTHNQIAEHLQIPLGTVKTNLYRGLASLREEVATQGPSKETHARSAAAESGRTS